MYSKLEKFKEIHYLFLFKKNSVIQDKATHQLEFQIRL